MLLLKYKGLPLSVQFQFQSERNPKILRNQKSHSVSDLLHVLLYIQDADNRLEEYRIYYRDRLFPTITERYKKKYGGSFPLSSKPFSLHLFKDCVHLQNNNNNHHHHHHHLGEGTGSAQLLPPPEMKSYPSYLFTLPISHAISSKKKQPGSTPRKLWGKELRIVHRISKVVLFWKYTY